jgi:hypothetical protein
VSAVEESFEDRDIKVLSASESLALRKSAKRKQDGQKAKEMELRYPGQGYLDRHMAECERVDSIEERKRSRESAIDVEIDRREEEREREAISAEADRRELEAITRARDKARQGIVE